MSGASPSRRTLLKFPAALAMSGGLAALQEARAAGASESGERSYELPTGTFHLQVDDFRMLCEIRGDGPLLIHQTGIWMFSSVATMAPLNEALAKHFTVLTMDCRGQGGSTLGGGSTNYSRAAADTARMMDVLDIEQAHFFGVSDGGCIQLELLLDFEERVASSTLCGTPYSHDAYTPALQATFRKWHEAMLTDSGDFFGLTDQPHSPETMAALKAQYAAVSPHPERFLEVMRGQRRCWATQPDVSLRRLAAIQRPVLVVKTNEDEYIPPAAFDALESAVPGATSITLDGMKHSPLTHAEEISTAIAEFTEKLASA
ncbi:MAG: alpha/beta hydrolase [Acidobacteriota bacterium]